MKVFYHGSPTPNIEILEPRFDTRLEMEGLFVADEPFGPMMFALLPVRAHAIVNYETKEGRFIKGEVVTPAINDEGWLYTVMVGDEIIVERKKGRFHLTAPVKVSSVKKITKEEVLKLGWNIVIKERE